MPAAKKNEKVEKQAEAKKQAPRTREEMVQQMVESMEKKGMTKQQLKDVRDEAEKRFLQLQADMYRQQQQAQMAAYTNAMRERPYDNVFTEMEASASEWFELKEGSGKWVKYAQMRDTKWMDEIIALFSAELTEPYSVFTYEHFCAGFNDLTILAMGLEQKAKPAADAEGKLVGAVSSGVSYKKGTNILRGYVAMLAVKEAFRGGKLGSKLVRESIKIMKAKKCDEVVLETPTYNKRALELYTSMGFATVKFLKRYYMDGSDAVRLKLWLEEVPAPRAAAAAAEDDEDDMPALEEKQ